MQNKESELRAQIHDISTQIRHIDETMAINYQHIAKCYEYLSKSEVYDHDIAAREQDMQCMMQHRMDLTLKLRILNNKLIVARKNMYTYSR